MPYVDFKTISKEKAKIKKEVYNVVRSGHSVKYGFFSKYGNDSAIYGIKSKTTGKQYIGATKHLQRRLMKHFNELKFGRHRAKQLQKDYNLYGMDDFEIIVYVNNPSNLLEEEKNLQLKLTIDNLYNEKISGNYIHPDYREKLANSNKSTHKTIEYRKKISTMKTNKIAQYYLDGEFIKVWNSAIEICDALGHTRSVILSACNGSKKQAYGYLWKYVDDNGNIISNGYEKARKKF